MKLNRIVSVVALGAACLLSVGGALAQNNTPPAAGGAPGAPAAPGGGQGGGRRNGGGPGGFDPAQMRERMMNNIKENLGFKDDEWTAVQPLVQKVMDARRNIGGGMGGMFRRPGGGGPGGDNGGRRGGGPFGGEPSPEAEALQKAVDDNAPAAQLKAALERFRTARKDNEAKLQAAQDDLRKVLTTKQEAAAALMSLVN